jgi:hypothetical protein
MSAETQPRSNNLTPIIDHLSKGAAVIASLGLVVSVFYDWGFYYALGLRFSEAPTSVSDHVRSWLVWLPTALFSLVCVIAFEMVTRRIEGGMTEEEIVQSAPEPARTRRNRLRPMKFLRLTAYLIIASWVLFGDLFNRGLYIGLIIVWFALTGWVFGHPRIRARHSEAFRLILHWGPPILIWFFFSGFGDAMQRITLSKGTTSVLRIKSSQQQLPMQASIIRTFEKWILVQDSERRLLWIPVDDVAQIQSRPVRAPFRGVACWFVTALCSPVYDDPKAIVDPKPLPVPGAAPPQITK